jgi:hypothetical protein
MPLLNALPAGICGPACIYNTQLTELRMCLYFYAKFRPIKRRARVSWIVDLGFYCFNSKPAILNPKSSVFVSTIEFDRGENAIR